ncbi:MULTISPECIES: MmcQ/YjbR family DNA-binding protein [unclassified Streptomyces]|uniref:MmcQ/YjbR family DNA-binding protein n=1 Tax=unclassified Streptomyces TaxID=2593676 RepID=UPI000B048E4B|nr:MULTISPECIES: MmcQ/YjbR family DNA-binding protein [unclassified Streptomyces]AZM62395.1 DNA-binding protein [Streptomyces sp. WAC 01438]RSM93579.1 DNA-binding protein [Streptomyces sp. WAC 01420]
MTPAQLRTLCLSFNAAVEDFPFNPETSVFKVGGKLFALSTLDRRPLTVNLKCDPEDAVRLRAGHPGLIVPGYHMNKRHWNTVTADGSLPDRLVRELVEDSYDLVVAGLPRAERLRLDRP